MRLILYLGLLFLMTSPVFAAEEVLWRLDFQTANRENGKWWENQGFLLRMDAERIQTRVENNRMYFISKEPTLGLFSKEVSLEGVNRVRIHWGVVQYPQGANWEAGIYREAISVVISFGEVPISSGSYFLPALPPFISLFLGEKAIAGKRYLGHYYQEGGRYFCVPCGVKEQTLVVTEFDLKKAFAQEFPSSPFPKVTNIAFEIDTRDTLGVSEAFVERVEFLR